MWLPKPRQFCLLLFLPFLTTHLRPALSTLEAPNLESRLCATATSFSLANEGPQCHHSPAPLCPGAPSLRGPDPVRGAAARASSRYVAESSTKMDVGRHTDLKRGGAHLAFLLTW
ncbi:hypothetical protein B0T16DRAFT_399191 [Cercophora newfieldiana]|uniref:Uncharacterized protein n=1 Tax=Cercophora newfieldiana TaxID=92897 RepID=A0AA40CYK5_9PEZI|nr:hypothetical protein B0T16DRAFT_399191 [Cercophora newfieldiana]